MTRFKLPCLLTALLPALLGAPGLQAQTISSFTPELGQVLQPVIIQGSGFWFSASDRVTQVWFGDILLPDNAGWFYINSPSQITAYVPPGAVDAPISVKRPLGPRVYSATDFNVIGPEPYVTSFSPTFGPGGTVITIDGVQFQTNQVGQLNVTAVRINGTNVASYFVQSNNRILATAQTNVTTGPISVVGNGTGTNTTTDLFYVPPVISGFNPPSGRAGDALAINGVNFTGTSQVFIGNVGVPVFNVNGNTQIVATVPSGAVSGKVIVWTPGGQYQTPTNFVLLPSITGFTPGNGTTNTAVTISGANLNVPPLQVTFNGVPAGIVSSNFNQIVATAPASTSGRITVTTGDGTVTSAGVFHYPPGITGFTPGSGPAGTVVTISGKSFTNATSVQFDGAPALFFSVSNNATILAAAPNNVSTGPLTVTAPGGVAVSAGLFHGPATFTGFLPAEGLPGVDVILFGSNFEGATAVTFNGTPAPLLSNTGTQIGTRVPTNATTGPIRITTPAGTVVSASVFTVPGVANLRINTLGDAPDPVPLNGNLTLTVVPANDGPNAASNVTASVTLAPGLGVVSASTTKGTVNTNGNPVVFSVGTLTLADNPTLTLVVSPSVAGLLTNFVTLASTTHDPVPGNNTGQVVTTAEPVAELTINRSTPGQIRIAWPLLLSNHVLQSTLSLTNPPNWINVPGTPGVDGNQRVVTTPSTGTAKFYRLKK